MTHDTTEIPNGPADMPKGPLTELLRRGARGLVRKTAVEAELLAFMGT